MIHQDNVDVKRGTISLNIFRVLPVEKDKPESRSKIISLFEGLLAKTSPLASLIDLSVEE